MDKNRYVLGFLLTWNMDRWLGIDKGEALGNEGNRLKITGIGGKIKKVWQRGSLTKVVEPGEYIEYDPSLQDMIPTVRNETPHEAMFREFNEETGYPIISSRWHCVSIKEYVGTKIYNFAAFCSPIEMEEIVAVARDFDNGEGKISAYELIDIFFDANQFSFDTPYILQYINREMINGFFVKLDPEGVNSDAL